MKIRSSAALALVLGLGVALAGCDKMNEIRAMKAFKDGNKLYVANDYRAAAVHYEEAIQMDPEDNINSCGGSPGCVYFYLGNSYDNIYRPTRKGEPNNDALLDQAIANYKMAAEKITNDPKMRTLALQYLVAAYGPDKLNDPTQAEPVVLDMIKLEPNEPTNYFVLAQIYADSGEYELAEETYLKAKEVRPNDPMVYMRLAGFYNQQGDFEKTIEAVHERTRIEPNNPEAFQTLATYYWDKAYRDFRLSDKEKMQYVQSGIEAVDRALNIKDDYMEAVAYKNLLLRLQANLETDPARQKQLLNEADKLRDRATELRKQKAAGTQ
ncbi:MAG TPA: tetratricopeptide repeat protein [Vicinamibacterales bacterium]|nr:tetratricopeptide repeat protein [Vicinamibacterales bacterium]